MKKLHLLLLGIFLSISSLGYSQARLQVIHNAADAAAELVDVWLDDVLLLDNFSFRTASPFMDAPSGQAFTISILGPESTSPENPLWSQNYNLQANETYLFIANGIISPTGYDPVKPFDIYVLSGILEEGVNPMFTEATMFHGATDAPNIDVIETGVGLGFLIQDFPYGFSTDYASLFAEDYIIEIRDADNDDPLAAYHAPLASLGLGGQAITVLASGFLNPEDNSDGKGFGLYVALAAGGDLLSMPTITSINEQSAINHMELFPNPAKEIVNISYELKTSGEVSIGLFNLVGAQVYSATLGNKAAGAQANLINVENLKEGMYLLRITSNNAPISQKLMISR